MQGATRAKERKTRHFKFLHFSAVCETQRCPTFSPPVVELLSIDCLPQTVWKLCCHLCKHILSAAKVCLIHCNRNLSYHNKIELELELNVVSQTELRKGICWWAGDFLKAPSFRSPWVCSLLEGLYDFSSDSWRMKTYEDNLADAKTFRRQSLFWNVLCSWSDRGQPLSEAVRARCKGRQFVWRSYGLKFRALSLFPEHLSSKWIMQVTFLYRHVRLACRIHYELWLNNTQQILECSFALWHSIQPCLSLSTCLRDSWQALAWNVSHLWDWPMKFLHIVLSMHFKGAGCNKGKGTQNKSF